MIHMSVCIKHISVWTTNLHSCFIPVALQCSNSPSLLQGPTSDTVPISVSEPVCTRPWELSVPAFPTSHLHSEGALEMELVFSISWKWSLKLCTCDVQLGPRNSRASSKAWAAGDLKKTDRKCLSLLQFGLLPQEDGCSLWFLIWAVLHALPCWDLGGAVNPFQWGVCHCTSL